jgi:hypothetical protein
MVYGQESLVKDSNTVIILWSTNMKTCCDLISMSSELSQINSKEVLNDSDNNVFVHPNTFHHVMSKYIKVHISNFVQWELRNSIIA